MTAFDSIKSNQRQVEQVFMALVYLYPAHTVTTCRWLSPDKISDDGVRRFWAAMLESGVNSNTDDNDAGEIATRAALAAGIAERLLGVESMIPTGAMPKAYADEIQRRAYLGDAVLFAQDIVRKAALNDDTAVEQAVKSFADGVQRPAVSGLMTSAQVAAEFNARVDRGNVSIKTGLSNIDASELGGLDKSSLIILAARPSMGKTALSLQIARNVSIKQPVLYYSLEMARTAIWQRIACPKAGVPWSKIKTGAVTADERAMLKNAAIQMADTYPNLVIADGRHTTDTIYRAVAEHRPELIVIDHLRKIGDARGETDNKRQGYMTTALKAMAKEFDLPVLLLVQLSRGVERKEDKRPVLSDLRDSGEIEEDADIVLMLYRESYYSGVKVANDHTQIFVRKYRDGESNGIINLGFDAPNQWFVPWKKL